MTPEQEIKLLKELLYCTKRSCNNCGKVNCENFQRQRVDCCGLWVSYKDYIKQQEEQIADIKANCDLAIEGRDIKIMELETQIEKMKCSQNCKHLYINLCDLNFCTCSNCKDKWEIKEND